MFDIVESLQGPSAAAVDSDDNAKGSASSSKAAAKQQAPAEPAGRFSLWGMATALAENVKKSTADIATSVKETNWRAELETFGKGVADDSHEAQEIMQKGLSSLESFPRQATAHLPAGLGAGLEGFGEQIAGGVDPTIVQQRINKRLSEVGIGLRGIGSSMFTGTRELLEHVTEAISSELDSIEGMAARNKPQQGRLGSRLRASGGSAKYSRLEAEISAMQRNSSTYCDEPEDSADYRGWLESFDLAARKPDIDAIIADNAFMAELQARIVPLIVQYNDFWTRYFYQLHKLQQKHEQRQKLAQRAQAAAEAEIAWDDDTPRASPAASPQKPEHAPTQKDYERVGARQSPPAPVVICPGMGQEKKHEVATTKQTSPTTKGNEEHSDVETSTASEGSSGSTPWTVVTSPRGQGPQDEEVTSPPRAAESAAPAKTPSKAAAPSEKAAAAAVASPKVEAAAVSNPGKASAGGASDTGPGASATTPTDGPGAVPVPQKDTADPKKQPAAATDDDEDLEISDEEGLAAEGDGSEVDEDWGGDWE